MRDYDDEPMLRPKWLGWLIIIGMIAVVLGLINLGVRLYVGTPADQSTAQRVQALVTQRPELQVGKTAVENSDCMRCHGVDRKFVGPSFVQIGDRYASQSDAQAYLANKIREGSVGVWGNVIMPRHPQVTQQQAEAMAQWILALPPAIPN